MKTYIFEAEQWLPRPRGEIFEFFSDARNLQELTPAWLSFRILSRCPLELKPGALVRYRLKIRGFPVAWLTEITAWEPPVRFVDEQRRGPYRLWVHEHYFHEATAGTLVKDRVRYAVPGGCLVNRFLVRPDIERIFAFRRQKLQGLFSAG